MFCACPVCPSGIYTSVNVHTLLLNRAIQRAAHGSKILVYKELAAFTKARSQTAPESVVSGKHGHDLCNSCQINQLRSGTGQDVPVPESGASGTLPLSSHSSERVSRWGNNAAAAPLPPNNSGQ